MCGDRKELRGDDVNSSGGAATCRPIKMALSIHILFVVFKKRIPLCFNDCLPTSTYNVIFPHFGESVITEEL